jgi:drug/metabolite transporter (DMT)-like permease
VWAGGQRGVGGGLILAKQGAADIFPALSVTLMRMTDATVTLWLFTAPGGRSGRPWAGSPLTGRRGYTPAGPFLGVTPSIVAIQHIVAGIASTLMALPPVFLLPLRALMFGERVGWQAVLGTGVALVGLTLLCLLG